MNNYAMNESLIVHRPSSNSFVLKQDFRWEPAKRDALRADILSALVSSYLDGNEFCLGNLHNKVKVGALLS